MCGLDKRRKLGVQDDGDLPRPYISALGAPVSHGAPAAVYFASDESALCSGTELVLDKAGSAGIFVDLPDALYDPALRA